MNLLQSSIFAAALGLVYLPAHAQDSEFSTESTCGPDAAVSVIAVGPRQDDVWRFVNWVEDADKPEPAFVQDISGPCLDQVLVASGGTVQLRSGATFQYDLEGRGSRVEVAEWMFDSGEAVAPLPSVEGMSFVSHTRIDGPRIGDGGQRNYLGLWRGDEKSVIAKFSIVDGLGTGPASALITSQHPLSGLVYFPSPDTQSGGISFLQSMPDGSLRSIGLGWNHPDEFPCLTPDQLVVRVPTPEPRARNPNRLCG